MAHTLLIVMLCLSLFSCHRCPQSAEPAPEAPRVTSGRSRAGCLVQQCRTARKGSLCCTSYYYFKCYSDCKEREKVIYFSYLFMPGILSVLSPSDHPIRGSVLALSSHSPMRFPSQPGGQGKQCCTSCCFALLSGLPIRALAGSQPAGR